MPDTTVLGAALLVCFFALTIAVTAYCDARDDNSKLREENRKLRRRVNAAQSYAERLANELRSYRHSARKRREAA